MEKGDLARKEIVDDDLIKAAWYGSEDKNVDFILYMKKEPTIHKKNDETVIECYKIFKFPFIPCGDDRAYFLARYMKGRKSYGIQDCRAMIKTASYHKNAKTFWDEPEMYLKIPDVLNVN